MEMVISVRPVRLKRATVNNIIGTLMSVDSALLQLKDAYDAVAHELEAEFPVLWQKVMEFSGGNNRQAAVQRMLMPVFGERETLIEKALRDGEDACINRLSAIEHGVVL